MTQHEEGIIREAANAAQMARVHGCEINVEIHRWGHTTMVKVTPQGKGEVALIGDDTEVIQIEPSTWQQQQDTGGDN